MTWLRKLAALPPAGRRLLLTAAALVPALRLALLVLPFPIVTRAVARLARPAARRAHTAERIAWAVRAAGRRLPLGGNCLAQALAACLMLRRHGHHAAVRLGVARDARGRLTAHAWVESDGTVLVGAPEHQGYVPLPAWEARA